MKVVKKMLALVGLVPGTLLIFFGAYNALITLLNQIFSDFYDFTNFSLVNLFTPFASLGGSGTFLDYIVAGPGASGGSAVRYWVYMVYALLASVGYAIFNFCWKEIKK
jgi:phosphotransferase system  glucose/maltose/N-acetylglucosamine-specific IIC component